MVKKNKNKIVIFILLMIVIVISVGYLIVKDFNLPKSKYTFITIKNGTTGRELTITDSEQVDEFISKFNVASGNINTMTLSGLGYKYKILIGADNSKEELFIQSSDRIRKGLFEYKLDKSFVMWIDDFFGQ